MTTLPRMKSTTTTIGLLCLVSLLTACVADAPAKWSGYAEADLIYVASSGAGVLNTLKVQRGDTVTAGADLFQLDAAVESYSKQAAQAQQSKASAQLADLSKGRRTNELKAITAQLEQAKAAQSISTSQLKRHRELVRQGYVTPSQMDELEAAQARDSARIHELQAQLAVAKDSARPDTLAAAKAELQSAQAQVSQQSWAEEQKVRHAPVAARVFDVLYRVGEWVAPGSPVVVLLPEHGVKVRFYVPQAALSQAKVGQAVSYACDGCAPGTATIRYVSPQAEFTPPVIYSNDSKDKLVYMIEATPDAKNAEALKPGQPLSVTPLAAAPQP
ncbi:MAG: HlyD family efflux transporter periplasmic adaptor subunit [Burkholderiaceae bacterium]|nr:HlyD family efflux transporter periplasmic adaptor subunit [Burkholderiaceae bacterium]